MARLNKEDQQAYDKKYYEEHKAKVLERQKKRYEAKKESIIAQQKTYVEKNKGKIALRRDKWMQENPEKVKEYSRKSQAIRQRDSPEYRKKNAENARKWRQALKLEMIEAYGGKCVECGETRSTRLTINHKEGFGCQHRRFLFGDDRGGTQFYSWLKTQGWPQDKFDLKCFSCNCEKTEQARMDCAPINRPSTHQRTNQEQMKGEIT